MSSEPGAAPVRYKKLEKLGEGTYGEVYEAYDVVSNRKVALKIMKLDQEEDGIPATTLREMSILRSVSHPNIVALLDVSIQPGKLMLVCEYMESDMRRLLFRMSKKEVDENGEERIRRGLDMALLQSYSFQLLAGLYVLHTHRIFHRDIKPENILINKDGLLKICDFGLSRYFSLPMRQYSPNVVSIWYRAPELLFGVHYYDLAIDIWSAGCIIAEMTTGLPLFKGDSDVDQLHKIFSILGTPDPEAAKKLGDISTFETYQPKDLREVLKCDDQYLIDLITKMLAIDPAKRITVQEALEHPFFNDLNSQIRDLCSPAGFRKPQ